MSILDKITGKYVKIAGGLIVSAAAAFVPLGTAVAIGVCTSVYCLDQFYPKAFNWLHNFAEPAVWPSYVSLGVAAMIAHHVGGWQGYALLGGFLTMIDGTFFDALY